VSDSILPLVSIYSKNIESHSITKKQKILGLEVSLNKHLSFLSNELLIYCFMVTLAHEILLSFFTNCEGTNQVNKYLVLEGDFSLI
jgi:hypothetical protein